MRRAWGRGCPLSEAIIRDRLSEQGKELLSSYCGNRSPVRLRCHECGWEWTAIAANALRGHGCYRCKSRQRRLSATELLQRCRRARVTLVSRYRGASGNTRIRVQCLICGRVWEPLATVILGGRGCPVCFGRYGEEEERVRKVVERVTGWRFPKARPVWLKGRSSRPLELDGYNKRHQVAFEYQGYQHYQPRWSASSLAATKRRDERKRVACYRRGVLLIRIPYWKSDVADFVRGKLQIREGR